MVQYLDGGKYAILNGMRFCRDDKTGYYLNSNTSTRLHRSVWESVNGPIPAGYEIHHIDHDKSNNEIENLAMLTVEDHHKIHADEMTEEHRDKLRQNLIDTARPKASEWHGSESGREWHKGHYDRMKDKLHQKGAFVCDYCGEEYVAEITGKNRFCSNACKSAYRRKFGIDNEKRVCVVCGAEFETNKYSKAKTCSRRCRNLSRKSNRSSQNAV